MTTDVRNRAICGFWDVLHRVSSPVGATHWAMAERGSMAFAISLCNVMVSPTVTSASANAASVSPPATAHVKARLLGTSSCICGGAFLRSLFRVDDHSEGLVFHRDVLQGVLCRIAALCHNHRDGVAHVANPILGKGRMVGSLEVGIRDQPSTGKTVQCPFCVLPCVDGDDARLLSCLAGIYGLDIRISVGAAKDSRMNHAG